MPKNPFLLCFEHPVSEQAVHLLREISDEFHQIYPHAFLLYIYRSPSSAKRIIEENFRENNHFIALVQDNQKVVFSPFSSNEPPSE